MAASQLFLIIVSGLGVIHGLYLALYLWVARKGNPLANRLLSALLLVLSFRVGKSVFLEFLEDLDVKFIFIGLGTLMAIGPLFYLYAQASADRSFRLAKTHLLHFAPCIAGIVFGFWIDGEDLKILPKSLFFAIFIGYYSHYLVYLLHARRYIARQRAVGLPGQAYKLLTLLFYGLLIVWVAYVLNLFDDLVPYVLGPILYSAVAYTISFIVISKGYLQDAKKEKYKTTRVSDQQIEQLFLRVSRLVVEEKQFKNPELTLRSLSEALKVSTQVLSMVINQKSQKNFNAYVNGYRVEEAIALFNDPRHKNHTISAIAYEVGFNSLSSFNSAFKKQTNEPPKAYRQRLTE